jgi:hypothetical protein
MTEAKKDKLKRNRYAKLAMSEALIALRRGEINSAWIMAKTAFKVSKF